MGLGSNGKKVLYSLNLGTRANVATVAASLRRFDSASSEGDRPIVYVDSNNVINVMSRKASDPVAHTANFLKEWAQEGLIIVPVCDGPRPQSKQQTNKSRAVRQKCNHDSFLLRQQLRIISDQLKNGCPDADTRTRLEDEQIKMGKAINRAETQSMNVVPPNFPTILEEELKKILAHEEQKGGGYVTPVVTAEFEADALIKGAFQKKEFQLVMSNDADYPVDLGDNCFAIKEFGHKNLVITSTCKESLLSVMSSLGDSSKATLIEPQWPIYEGVLNYRLRALISVTFI